VSIFKVNELLSSAKRQVRWVTETRHSSKAAASVNSLTFATNSLVYFA